jgi:hypothetical protein
LALFAKKDYGNVDADDYVEWFRPFAAEFRRIVKPEGSFVIDIGGAWKAGSPTKSLYQYELLLMLCKEFDFQLAQEFFLVEPFSSTYTRRMGKYSSHTRKRRRKSYFLALTKRVA